MSLWPNERWRLVALSNVALMTNSSKFAKNCNIIHLPTPTMIKCFNTCISLNKHKYSNKVDIKMWGYNHNDCSSLMRGTVTAITAPHSSAFRGLWKWQKLKKWIRALPFIQNTLERGLDGIFHGACQRNSNPTLVIIADAATNPIVPILLLNLSMISGSAAKFSRRGGAAK